VQRLSFILQTYCVHEEHGWQLLFPWSSQAESTTGSQISTCPIRAPVTFHCKHPFSKSHLCRNTDYM
jgi:hypothetical protein